MKEFKDMSLEQLAEWHNERCEDVNLKPVKKFANKESALRRCVELKELLADEPPKKAKKEKAEPKTKEEISAAISRGTKNSWQNEETRKARTERRAVLVQKVGEEDATAFQSVASAFNRLELPMNKHIAFRAKLKKEQKLEEFGYIWHSIPYTEYQEMVKAEKAKPKEERNLEDA